MGPFKNGGQEWQLQGEPEAVQVHDFVDPAIGRASPYGVYDLAQNAGWVSVGIDHDMAAFAVESIRRWWNRLGETTYPQATRLLITADGGGSNGSRVRLWKLELHRLFAFISQNWRAKPLVSSALIVSLIAATTTTTGLRVSCELDANAYAAGGKVSEAEPASVRLERDAAHGEWNYTIHLTAASAGVIP